MYGSVYVFARMCELPGSHIAVFCVYPVHVVTLEAVCVFLSAAPLGLSTPEKVFALANTQISLTQRA